MKTILCTLLFTLPLGTLLVAADSLASSLEKGLIEEEVNRDFDAAIAAYESAITRFDKDRELAATAIFRLAEIYRRTGRTREAEALYQRLIREFHDQPELAGMAAERLPEDRTPQTGSATGSSEFSSVTIRIQTEDGRSIPGYRVRMQSDNGRRVSASGESDETGLALSRNMPYGDYSLRIAEPTGWETRFRTVTVEVGAPFEKIVHAPDPQKRATVEVRSAIAREAFAGIRFGHIGRPRQSSLTPPPSPEPGEEPGQFDSFPEYDDGIRDVAVEISFHVESISLTQPDGEGQTWHWRGKRRPLLASADGVRVIDQIRGGTVPLDETARYFTADPRKEPRRRYLGEPEIHFHKLTVDAEADSEISMELAAGEITFVARRILGRADANVLTSLGVDDDSEVWLEAKLKEDSAWASRILETNYWTLQPEHSILATQTLTLEPGETAHITVNSPPDSSP